MLCPPWPRSNRMSERMGILRSIKRASVRRHDRESRTSSGDPAKRMGSIVPASPEYMRPRSSPSKVWSTARAFGGPIRIPSLRCASNSDLRRSASLPRMKRAGKSGRTANSCGTTCGCRQIAVLSDLSDIDRQASRPAKARSPPAALSRVSSTQPRRATSNRVRSSVASPIRYPAIRTYSNLRQASRS